MPRLRKKDKLKKSGLAALFAGMLCLSCLLPVRVHATATDAAASPETNTAGPGDIAKQLSTEELEKYLIKRPDDFTYRREGRTDPFEPFITEEVLEAEIKEAEEELTGMRKFEPGQLTLVAIIFRGAQSFAMVQDAAGKGYILKKGTLIGRSGEVVEIVANKVVIQEESYTATRQKRQRTIEMVLKKEGEK